MRTLQRQISAEIYFAEISEVESAETADLLKLISHEKQKKLMQYHFPIDRKLSLYAELLVRYKAMCLLDLTNNEIEFETNEYGKPHLKGYPEFYFNISHTRNAIAVAFSNETIGVDIEKIRDADLQIAQRFFTNSEQRYIGASLDDEYNRRFYEVWTKKEAYIKCIGTGLTTSLKSINVVDTKGAELIYIREIKKYILSVCCREFAAETPTFVMYTEDDLQLSFSKIATH